MSQLFYLLAIPVSFLSTSFAQALFVVALVWLIPDRRIEKTLGR